MSSSRRSWFRVDDEPDRGLGKAIKIRRIELGLERKDLAERSGLSYPYLSEIENGTKPGSARALRAIAEALGLELHELLEQAAALHERAGLPALPPPDESRLDYRPARMSSADDLAPAPPRARGARPRRREPPKPSVADLARQLGEVLADADPYDAEAALLLVLGEGRVRDVVRDELRRSGVAPRE